jgi:Fusaric acid resistance protein-like
VTAHSIQSGAQAHPYDDQLPPAPRPRLAWLGWLEATDPGQMRLRMALENVLAIGVVLLAEWLFVRTTGALQVAIPAKAPAALATQLWMVNHALTVIAMMLGAIIAMVGGFGVGMFGTARAQLGLMLYLPLPMLAMLALGLTVHVRVISLALFVVVLTIGTYCRRFGPPGFMGGMLAFMGAFLGFFIQDYVSLADFGWLAAEVAIGAAGLIAVHFALFRPRPQTAVRRMQRSYAARARALASQVSELYEATARSGKPTGNQTGERRLQRHLLRLNEAALLIDAQLNSPAAVPPGWSAAALHQRLFDAEAALSNVARFALTLARRPLPERVRALVAAALRGARDGDLAVVCDAAAAIRELLDERDPDVAADDRVLLHRFASSVTDLATALRAFRLYPASQPPDDAADEGFQPQVATFAGWLPGSAFVAGTASQERHGGGLIERIRLAPYARIAIQMGVAVGGAILAGDAMSGRRFYWAVIAAFITFMGANTAGEQLRKGIFRVAGTFIGVIVGSVLAHLVGDRVWLQILVVLVSLFLGLYLFRINYAFMTIGITVLVSQLYVELDELSNQLLVLRLGETAVGAGVAIVTVLLVLPLRVGRVARVAARQQLEALADLADRCLDRLADPASGVGSDLELRASARRADAAYQELASTVRPMRTPLFGSLASRITGFMATSAAARHYARNLVLDAATRYADLDAASVAALAVARQRLADSVGAVTEALAPAALGAGASQAVAAGNVRLGNDAGGDGARAGGDSSGNGGAGNGFLGDGASVGGASVGGGGSGSGGSVGGGSVGGGSVGAAGEGDGGRGAGRPYVRSASLFERVADTLPCQPPTSRPHLALRDLELLDGAFAEAARWAGVPVTDLDTVAR